MTAGLAQAEKCPVCQARFRGVKVCSRCGADLSRLMRLSAEAWQWREWARQKIVAGEFAHGLHWAARAQGLRRTPKGEVLVRLAEWLGK